MDEAAKRRFKARDLVKDFYYEQMAGGGDFSQRRSDDLDRLADEVVDFYEEVLRAGTR